jgi:hypothetical protein
MGSNGLALASFLLSLISGVEVVLNVLVFFLSPLPFGVNVYLYLFGSALGIGAIVMGGLAVSWAKWYPPQQAWKGWAIAGLVLGSIGTVLHLFVGVGFLVVLAAFYLYPP